MLFVPILSSLRTPYQPVFLTRLPDTTGRDSYMLILVTFSYTSPSNSKMFCRYKLFNSTL